MNCVSEYAAMYLKIPKEVTRAARPSRITVRTQEMLVSRLVNGEATEDSVSDKEIPVCAAFNAPQSLAPSPTMAAKKKEFSTIKSFHNRQ